MLKIMLASVLTISIVTASTMAFLRSQKHASIKNPKSTAGQVQEEDDEAPTYDIVIIGGGTAGCVLANRLSEDPKVRVLLLEAGGSSRNVRACQIPLAYSQLMGSALDYQLWTEPQTFSDNLRKAWPRAKMLGGCSSMNAMIYYPGAPSEYDEWAQTGLEGADGWSFQNFEKYFRKLENYVSSSKSSDVNATAIGKGGPMTIGLFSTTHDSCLKWIQSCYKLGIPRNADPTKLQCGVLGAGKVMTFIDNFGRRVTTETGYLTPEVLKRPNLTILTHCAVNRILFETGKDDTLRAVAVEFVRKDMPDQFLVRVKHEVVLSAGAVHSPQILMLSGVGPKDHLADHGIPLVHDVPGVGQNLQDHLAIHTRFRVKDGGSMQWLPWPQDLSSKIKRLGEALRWKFYGSGLLTSNLGEAAAFIRSDDLSLTGSDSYHIDDETSSPEAPDLETIIIPLAYTIPKRPLPLPRGELMTLATILLRPQSTGTITLRSNNPRDPPVIDPKCLSAQNDRRVLVRGLKFALRTTKTEPFASVIQHDDDPLLDHGLYKLSDSELESEVLRRPETLYHPASTCRMAKFEDGGVVDAYLRVHGIKNLRVVDTSVFPRIPAAHTVMPVMAVGEKAADMIKQSLRISTVL